MTEQQKGPLADALRETADAENRDRLRLLLEQIDKRVREFNELRESYAWPIDPAAFAAAVDGLDEAVEAAHVAIGDVRCDDGGWRVPEPTAEGDP
ncbi:MAG TPA: hypothetical protein VK550_31400 [Polyangiaceae bacterium]|nr:hypothetical protein [Polyangiaceae bacterium]